MYVTKKFSLGFVFTAFFGLLVACGGETPDRQPQVQQDSSLMTGVVIRTNKGDIELELDQDKAPLSVANFLSYVDSGYYEGTIFHRVIAGFMVQGGGFTETYQQKDTVEPVDNEASNGLKNVKYTIAMARTSVVDSATSQFFINVADNAFLDHRDTSTAGFGYAVFGRVTSGQDVVDAIASVQTGAAGRFSTDVPLEVIVIESVSRL